MLNHQILTGKFLEVLVYLKNLVKNGPLVITPTKSVEYQMVSLLQWIIPEKIKVVVYVFEFY